MALTDYERYQLEWMIHHGHSLTELIEDMSELSYDLPDAEVGALFDAWEADRGFGGEVFASESEWRSAEGAKQDADQLSVLDRRVDSAIRERVFVELGSRLGFGYDATRDVEERPRFKDRLVVLDTRAGWDGQTDALLYDPGAPKDLTPFIIATGFDAESVSWRSGSYRNDLMDALCEFRGTINPKWAISGCTPDDVMELHGDSCRIDLDAAEQIAREVNERLSNVDELFSDDLADCVEEWVEKGVIARVATENTPEWFAAIAKALGAQIVTPDSIMTLVENRDGPEARDHFGVFVAVEPSGLFTVCDNTTGDCFVETFETIWGAEAYLRGADAQRAYEIDREAAANLAAHDPSAVARSASDVARAAGPEAGTTRRSVCQ